MSEGVLKNGLKYILVKNDFPPGRVYMRLIVNAGSLNEDEDQKGIAHLCEHMAFNGSEKYPKNEIIDALESVGMKFARDINAYTDFENTIYKLNLEHNDEQTLDRALTILSEQMYHLTMLPSDIDSERGIVEEEWRRRLSPMLRLGDKKSVIEMAGSRYVKRDPIGDMSIVRNIPAKRVADFYHRWYRPDNMVVLIVGDFNEKLLHSLMDKDLDQASAKRDTPLEKIDYSVPLSPGWRVASVDEKGITTPAVEVSWIASLPRDFTQAGYKKDLLDEMVIRLVNSRLQTWQERQKGSALESASIFKTNLGRETVQYLFLMPLTEPDYLNQVKALFDFLAQTKQHGFTKEEVDTLRDIWIRNTARQRTIQSGSLKEANDLIGTVASNEPIISKKEKLDLNDYILKHVTVQEVNEAFNRMLAIPSRLVLVTQPYPAKALSFDKNTVSEAFEKALATPQPQWQLDRKHVDLPKVDVKPGDATLVKHWMPGDIYDYRLSNGARLIVHLSDKSPNRVMFKAFTPGGLRSIPKKDFYKMSAASQISDSSGVGPMSLDDVSLYFSSSPVAFASIMDDYRQGFAAAGRNNQLGALMQLFRLKLQGTPVDKGVYREYIRDTKTHYKELDHEEQFSRKIDELRYPTIPTIYKQNESDALAITLQEFKDVYDKYLLSKTNYTYFITGDVKLDQVLDLAKKYLAGAPYQSQVRQTYSTAPVTPKKPLWMHGAEEDRSLVDIYYDTNLGWTPLLQYQLDILSDIVEEHLRARLREDESGVYAINTTFTADKDNEQVHAQIEYSCDPKRAKFLVSLADQVIHNLVETGVTQEELDKALEEKEKEIRFSFDTLLSTTTMIENSFLNTGSTQGLYAYQHLPEKATMPYINALLRKLFADKNRFEAVLSP